MITKMMRCFSMLNKVRNITDLRQSYNIPRCLTHVPGDKIALTPTSYTQQINKLSPFQRYLIQNKSMERPFTGELWDEMDTGFYHCTICDSRLFSYNHKYQSHTGYATFWTAIDGRIRTLEQQVKFDQANKMRPQYRSHNDKHKRIQCAHCATHLGAVFFDGPPPSFLRYSVNSSMLKFTQMEDFQNPHLKRRLKRAECRSKKVYYIK